MPPPPTAVKRKAENGADEASDEEDEYGLDDADEVDRTPISHEIILKDHQKVVSAIAVDPSGARVATGSHDYDTKIWDFGGMDSRLKPFKTFEANGNYYVRLSIETWSKLMSRYIILTIRQMGSNFWSFRALCSQRFSAGRERSCEPPFPDD